MEAPLSLPSTGLSDHERTIGINHPVIDDGETLANAGQTRAMLGNVSDMWLHRHLNDLNPDTKFPEPDAVIANRRYWRVGTIRAWITRQSKGKTRGPVTTTAAVALFLLVAVNHQIWGSFTPAVTRGWDPRPYIAMETAAVQAFHPCRATAGGAGNRKW
jgi:hypothetical protein